jgi:hypothetical protein
MQKRIPFKYSFEVKDSYLSVTVSGHFSLPDAMKMYTESLEILVDKKLDKLFFNVLKVKGTVTTMDRFNLGEFAAFESIKYMGKGLLWIAVTFYGKEPIIDHKRFGELVARNRGLNLKVTTDKSEAFQFLGVE